MSLNNTQTTNDLTISILSHCLSNRIFAYRSSVTGIPDPKTGEFRAAPKTGIPDITGVLPGGRAFYIEVKTGRDRMRPEQIGFKINSERMGALHLVVKDFQDFQTQWVASMPLMVASHGK